MISCTTVRPLSNYDAILVYYENGLKSDNWQTRIEAVKGAAAIKGERAENVIIEALKDTHNIVKIEALQILYNKPIKRAQIEIRKLALYSDNDNVRWNALLTLSRYRDPRNAAIFKYNFENDDWLIREASIIGLLTIDDLSTQYVYIDVILKALNDPSYSITIAALSNLRFNHPDIYNTLINMLEKDDIINQPELIIKTFGVLRNYTIPENDKKKLIKFLTHNNTAVRIEALKTLKQKN